jgi:endonuclease/exonuclease/phosphatase family metal-dependent hydrolase
LIKSWINCLKIQKNIIICGDVNINDLVNTNYKQQLSSLLASYGLYSTVTFPTRVCFSSSTIDNIFINKCKNNNYTVHPWINRLSDHDGQIIILYNDKCNMSQKQIHA